MNEEIGNTGTKPERLKAVRKSNKKAVPKIVRAWMRQNTDVKLSSLCANPHDRLYRPVQEDKPPLWQNVTDCKYSPPEKPMLFARGPMQFIYNH